ncbi:hypothetical protein V6N13_033565 [Hibiscus sabdariffa]
MSFINLTLGLSSYPPVRQRGSESRVLIEERSLNQRFDSMRLRRYLQEEAEKNQFRRVERQSPGGPDPQHHK